MSENPFFSKDRICPNCEAVNDISTNADELDMPPIDGALSICAYCGTLSIFYDNTTKLRIPTEQEMKEIEEDESWDLVQKAQLTIIAKERLN